MSSLPDKVTIGWVCPCGLINELSIDLQARATTKTHKCSTCKRKLRFWKPVVHDLTPAGGAR